MQQTQTKSVEIAVLFEHVMKLANEFLVAEPKWHRVIERGQSM